MRVLLQLGVMGTRQSKQKIDRSADSPRAPRDALFGHLSHPIRRRVLLALFAASPDAVLSPDDFVAGGSRSERIRIELHHNHLPRLAAADYLEWNRRDDTVSRGPRFETIVPTIELLTEYNDRLPVE